MRTAMLLALGFISACLATPDAMGKEKPCNCGSAGMKPYKSPGSGPQQKHKKPEGFSSGAGKYQGKKESSQGKQAKGDGFSSGGGMKKGK